MTNITPINVRHLAAGGRVTMVLAALSICGCASQPAGPEVISADERVSIQRDAQRLFGPPAVNDEAALAGSARTGHEDSAEEGAP